MAMLTLNAKVVADEQAQAVLQDAMRCATKIYNGLLWNLREEFKQAGKTRATRKHLNAILKTLPRAKAYYSLSVQATRDEVIQAYSSFFALRAAGRTQHQMPGFRRKTDYSPLRYYEGFGFTLDGARLVLSLGTGRQDGVKSVTATLQVRQNVVYQRIVNILLTYDKRHGLCAHLVVEVEVKKPLGSRKVAVDLGETQAITGIFDDGTVLMYSGRLVKSIRRYWQKVRAKVKPPTAENRRKSRRFRQIERKESRQVEHLLHIMTTDFVRRCWMAGADTIAIGDLTGIRESIDYTDELNQRLHAWPFRKIVQMITYKASLYRMRVIEVSEAYTSQTCHACGEVKRSNRVYRGLYSCGCGWQAQADANAVANIFFKTFKVSPLTRSSGAVAAPVVVPIRLGWHTVRETKSQVAVAA
ncbi:MAG: transposase [Actinobacteria bacterium]|nr:transposase [Actinomycetota bacterium]